MAITKLNKTSTTQLDGGLCVFTGSGAPASTDPLVLDTSVPVGSTYLDTTTAKVWYKCANAGATTDWKGVTIA